MKIFQMLTLFIIQHKIITPANITTDLIRRLLQSWEVSCQPLDSGYKVPKI